MAARRSSTKKSFMAQATELSLAVPTVVAHRLQRIALAGPAPNGRDMQEFQRMGTEKVFAFYECWNEMIGQSLRVQQRLSTDFARAAFGGSVFSAALSPATLSKHALDIIGKGMSPVHSRAVANAKRLGRKNSR